MMSNPRNVSISEVLKPANKNICPKQKSRIEIAMDKGSNISERKLYTK